MCNLGAWLEKKKKWYTWIVGRLLNQKNNSTKSPVKNQLVKCYLITNWNVQVWIYSNSASSIVKWRGEWHKFQLLDRFVWVFIFCSSVIYRRLTTWKNNPHVSYQAVCSILVLQHSWSSMHTEGKAPRRAVLKDSLLTMEGVHRNSENSFSIKRQSSRKVGKLGNDLSYFSTHSGEQ